MNETFGELFRESLKTVDLRPGRIITGVVMAVDKDWVTVHVGLKSEGVIPRNQFQVELEDEGGAPEVGQQVEVMLETVDDGMGNTCLSREKALRIEAWKLLEDAHKNEGIVHGAICGKVKGGFTVNIGMVSCFLPGSLVDERPVTDVAHLEKQLLDFRVIRLEKSRNNVVLSRRAVLESQTREERESLLASLIEGQTVTGTVKNLTEYGAFVDLGGLDGLLHNNDMSWKRIESPADILSVGDEITASILRVDRENQRVSLGIKQLQDNPWEDYKSKYTPGSEWDAKVLKIVEYGCFVEIEEAVVGLVHVSEVDWLHQGKRISDVVQIGEHIRIQVIDVNVDLERISLSIKRCQTNPWDSFATDHKQGDRLSGVISSVTDFGLFVSLENGLIGLVHSSDVSWDEGQSKGDQSVLQNFKKGQQVNTVLLSVDPERERVGLSLRQANDPMLSYSEQYEVGSRVHGKVTKVLKQSAIVELADDVLGLLKVAQLSSSEQVDDVRELLKVGDDVEAMITEFDHKLRRVILSVKAMEDIDTKEAMAQYEKDNRAAEVKLKDVIAQKDQQADS